MLQAAAVAASGVGLVADVRAGRRFGWFYRLIVAIFLVSLGATLRGARRG